MKVCSDCKEAKPHSEFHKKTAAKDGLQAKCKDCNKQTVVDWQKNNPEKFEQNWRRNGYGSEKLLRRRAARYGLSVEELTEMLEGSGGKCEICKREPSRWLVVDHCHNSLKVRGVLCEKCNQAIGLLDDSIEFMQSAIEYLKKQ